MTGFARVEAQLEQGDLVWELRAVNHRFLDAQFKMPEDFRRLNRNCASGSARSCRVER